MLILSRRAGEKILIGDDITVTLLKIKDGNTVSIGIDAPRTINVDREEIAQRKSIDSKTGENK